MGILESLRAHSCVKIMVLSLALSALAQAQEPLLAIGKWLPQGVANLRVSSDGRYLLVMPHYYEDQDRNLELWRVSDGQRVAELHQRTQHLSAAFAPDQQHVVAIAEESLTPAIYASRGYVWDLEGNPVGKPAAVAGDLAEQTLPPSADSLVITNWENKERGDENGGTRWAEGRVQSWHWPSGKVRTLGQVRSRLEPAKVSRDGHWVATQGGDGALRIWDARLGGMKSQRYHVNDFDFSSDPDMLVVDGSLLRIPSLRKERAVDSRICFVGTRLLYQLDPPRILNGRTFQPIGKAQLQAAPGFTADCARMAGTLSQDRVLLWDPEHRAAAILSP